jgi:trehalose 2-sulfotransferase
VAALPRQNQTLKLEVSYIIASIQRSGTHLLGSILRSTDVAGSPAEHFLSKPGETWEERRGVPSRVAYVERVLRQNTGANGVFGTVVMWSYFKRMQQMLQEIPAYKTLDGAQLLAAVFCEPKYIWMRRRNHVEQAVSWAMACQTGAWTRKANEKSQTRAVPKFDFKVIDEWCKRIAAHDEGWANYFRENQIEPLVLFYEDVSASHRVAAERVLEFLGLPLPPEMEIPPPAVEKQATQISEEWAACYRKLKRTKASRRARVLRRMRL